MDLSRIQLPIFEGPLDLLLHLIEREELDITAISLKAISDHYLAYLELAHELDIELAANFLETAAELTRLKSYSLLPAQERETDDEAEYRDEESLLMRLKRYEAFRRAASYLSGRPRLGENAFKRAVCLADLPVPAQNLVWKGETPGKLIPLYRAVLARQGRRGHIHQVALEWISVREKMISLIDRFREGEAASLAGLLSDQGSRAQKIGVFLAMLELVRMRLFALEEDSSSGWTIRRSTISGDRVHHYEEEFRL